MRRHIGMLLCFVWMGVMVSACAIPGTTQKPYTFSQRGTIIWQDEFEFKPPSSEWRVIQVEVGGEFGFGFLKVDQVHSLLSPCLFMMRNLLVVRVNLANEGVNFLGVICGPLL